MKVALVPAQVTSVEDMIVNGLTLKQLVILMLPVFLCGVSYTLIPPVFTFTSIKLIVLMILTPALLVLAIKIKGELILNWALVIMQYNMRPKFYIFTKNDYYLRESKRPYNNCVELVSDEITLHKRPVKKNDIRLREIVEFEKLVMKTNANVAVSANNAGGIHVSISEIK